MLHLTDVTLRDGLQMESPVAVEKKAALFHKLLPCGFSRLEVASFVHPKWVPQFADSDTLCRTLFPTGETEKTWGAGPETMAFVPNEKGLERLLRYPIPWASTFVAASETFNQKNVNEPIQATLTGLENLIKRAHAERRQVRVYVSTVFGCPYEGAIKDKDLFALLH